MKISRKHKYIALLIGGFAATGALFTNASRTHSLSDEEVAHVELLVASLHARAEAQMAADSTDPAEQNRHAKAAQEIAEKIRSYKNDLKSKGKLRAPGAPTYSCEVIVENCNRDSAHKGRPVKVNTRDKKTCLEQAAAWEHRCDSMATATFYIDGEAQGASVSGSACMIDIKNCPMEPGLIGSFIDQEPNTDRDARSCAHRRTFYKERCGSTSNDDVAIQFIKNGKKTR